MKTKLIALLLVVLMLFSVTVLPATAGEAQEDPAYVKATEAALENAYNSVSAKLSKEVEDGYAFLYAQNDRFQLFANKYTGEIYLRDRISGQYLTSNPTDVGTNNMADKLSQVWLSYQETTLGSAKQNYDSFSMAAMKGQIVINKIENGIRVEYTMGDVTTRFIAPQAILAEDFTKTIIEPLQDSIVDFFENLLVRFNSFVDPSAEDYKLIEYTGEDGDEVAFSKYLKENIGIYGKTKHNVTSQFRRDYDAALAKLKTDLQSDDAAVREAAEEKQHQMIEQIRQILPSATKLPSSSTSLGSYVSEAYQDFNNLLAFYPTATSFVNVNTMTDEEAIKTAMKTYPILQKYADENGKRYDEEAGLVYPLVRVISLEANATESQIVSTFKNVQTFMTRSVGSYTLEMLLAQEDKLGFIPKAFENPLFRCAIEYTLDDTGMTVDVPASSIIFDETKYELVDLSFLRYLNAGSTTQDGYVFYPDGSGALIFNKEMTTSATLRQPIYSYDYALSSLRINNTGDSVNSSEPVRLPVFGSVNKDENGKYVGYLAIVTEGDAMAWLNLQMMQNSYVGVFPSYQYRARDNYMMSRLSGSMSITSDFKYTGYYTQKYVMLTDSTLNPDGYRSDYVGMATAYRDYLLASGTISALAEEELEARLPLYIESYATLETTKTVLSFPVNVDVALASFKDVQTMGEELRDAGIENVKFRLMGYYNDGYRGYYPNRIKWMKEAGGKKGFKALMNYVSEHAEEGFEVFTDVDLLYNYRIGKIGGISRKKTSVRSMDDRYVRKVVYSTIYRYSTSNRGLLISASKLTELFAKFDKKFSKFKSTSIALANLASDLSSNFNEDDYYTRQEAKGLISGMLEEASEKYTILSTGGNIYAIPYVDYLLEAPVDGSHYNFISRTIPFFGMVMHGAVQYAGETFNEAGNPDYEILRAIESGAGLYFILVYENTELMKEDEFLVEHYAANYEIWKNDLIKFYDLLDYAIGDLQDWTIINHQFLSGERKVRSNERASDQSVLESEYLELLKNELKTELSNRNTLLRYLWSIGIADTDSKRESAYSTASAGVNGGYCGAEAKAVLAAKMEETGLDAKSAFKELVETDHYYSTATGQSVRVLIDVDAIIAAAEEALATEVTDEFKAAVAEFKTKNEKPDGTTQEFTLAGVTNYAAKTANSFFTDSEADDPDYKTTDYTINDGSIVLVTYSNGTDTVRLLLNFGIFTVTVNYGGQTYNLGKYDFTRIDPRQDGKTDPRNQ